MTYYDFLSGIKDELEQKIVDFYNDRIRGKFPDNDCKWRQKTPSANTRPSVTDRPDNWHFPSDTFDVYITRNRERIYLIDFNPFAQKTDALLFDWSELLLAEKRMPMRLLASEAASQHMQQPFAFNRYPSDVTDLSNGQTVAEFAEAFYKKVQTAAK